MSYQRNEPIEMLRRLVLAISLAAIAPLAFGQADRKELNPWVDCGVGAMAFEETPWAAVTFNLSWDLGSTAVTSDQSSQDTCASKKAKTALYIGVNKEKLARDMSIGGGEALDSLAHLLGVQAQDRAAFGRIAKNNMPRIFPSDNVTTERIVAELREVLAADAQLARYTAAL